MEPEGDPKVNKIQVKIDAWKKVNKKIKKIFLGMATLRRTKRAGNIIRATPPTPRPVGIEASLGLQRIRAVFCRAEFDSDF